MVYFVEFDLWRLRRCHWRILCHCSQSKRVLVSLAPVEYSSLWDSGCESELKDYWEIGVLTLLPFWNHRFRLRWRFRWRWRWRWRFRLWLFRTWLPAYPCGPVPHYAEGRHLGSLWTPHMFQATCASRLTHRKSPRQPPSCRNVVLSITEFELTRSIKVAVNSPLSTNTLIQSPRRKNTRQQTWLYNPVNNLTLPAMTRSHAVLCKIDNFAQSCSKKIELTGL